MENRHQRLREIAERVERADQWEVETLAFKDVPWLLEELEIADDLVDVNYNRAEQLEAEVEELQARIATTDKYLVTIRTEPLPNAAFDYPGSAVDD